MTARAIAASAGWHESKSSRLPNGKSSSSDQDIKDWCRVCGAEEQIADFIAANRAAESAYVTWKRVHRAGLRRSQEATVPLYERTNSFRVYCSNVVPGLLQTGRLASWSAAGAATGLVPSRRSRWLSGSEATTRPCASGRAEDRSTAHRSKEEPAARRVRPLDQGRLLPRRPPSRTGTAAWCSRRARRASGAPAQHGPAPQPGNLTGRLRRRLRSSGRHARGRLVRTMGDFDLGPTAASVQPIPRAKA